MDVTRLEQRAYCGRFGGLRLSMNKSTVIFLITCTCHNLSYTLFCNVAQRSSAEIENWSDIRLYLLYSGAKMLKVAVRVSIRILLHHIVINANALPFKAGVSSYIVSGCCLIEVRNQGSSSNLSNSSHLLL